MKSLTQVASGRVAVKSRCSRSGARSAPGSERVVKCFVARLAPRMPSLRMIRATWSRPTSMPALWAAEVSLRRP